jgi:NhaP-type Na+/H+ or K+/H+ antiporter
MNWERLAIAALAAALLGVVYAYIVDRVYRLSPDHPYTFVLVIFGTVLTLLVTWIVVPVQWVIVTVLLFGLTGFPQIVGAMIRDEQLRRERSRQLNHELRRQLEETLQ